MQQVVRDIALIISMLLFPCQVSHGYEVRFFLSEIPIVPNQVRRLNTTTARGFALYKIRRRIHETKRPIVYSKRLGRGQRPSSNNPTLPF